ncbi:glycosyltransferase family 4 protein [Anaerobranca gottschalkii]|uniref:Glycosyltransferase involved in cell wall bisynthesis n=1 Tax=Anaerobranca gottschalkii DSM 13577 TaxID=1120990 RepID=A0A1I0AJP4_9FIRM|nr:glycosyltransferase family 4 protein [Anaerobranca gottschalkii]SES94525.1 Glycosyltransferase involved in cell wall bisynthesis [Anaerobranca gottschalkii DSM 13577]
MLIVFVKSTSLGGISTHIKELQRGLKKLNYQTEVIEINLKPLKFIKNILALRYVCHREEVIVHFHGYKAILVLPFIPQRVKKVCTIHGFLDEGRWRNSFLKGLLVELFKKVDHFICVSHSLKNYIQGQFKVPQSKITVIYNGVSVDNKEIPKNKGKKIINIGACGRLVKLKGYDGLIHAFNNIYPKFDVRLHIIGSGPEEENLKKLARDKVYFHGYKPNPLEYMEMFHLFVQPSLVEGCGVSVLEAMSLNIPVIVSDAGGLPELIEHGVHGLIFPKGDIKALTNCLIMVLSNKEIGNKGNLLDKLGINNRAWVAENFSICKMLELTISVYNKILGEFLYEKVV